jgi:hypothetical protein
MKKGAKRINKVEPTAKTSIKGPKVDSKPPSNDPEPLKVNQDSNPVPPSGDNQDFDLFQDD